jgi:hypothetical protein
MLHDPEMDWAMEEPLNFYNNVREWDNGADTQQLDLLFPIKEKEIRILAEEVNQ